MNAVYRITNSLVALVFSSTMALAAYTYAPGLWQALDNKFFSGILVVTLVGIITVGFLAMESRKV